MRTTLFSFFMSILWFNLYIIIINFFRKKDSFIINFTNFPLIFFLSLSIFRLVLSIDYPGAIIIRSKVILPKVYDFIRMSLSLGNANINILQIFIFIWVLGTISLIIRDIISYMKQKKELEQLYETRNKKNEELFYSILESIGISKKIQIIQHDDISSPFILGILYGFIFIPNISLSKEELEHIIFHEINHFTSKDLLKKTLIQGVKNIFWWNPFVHIFAKDFNCILEIQCDIRTTEELSDNRKKSYLETITKIIKSASNNMIKYEVIPNLINMGEIDSLKQRFRIVLNYRSKRKLFQVLNLTLCILFLLGNLLSYFVIIQPSYIPIEEDIFTLQGELDLEEDSFIIKNDKGKYELYVNNIFQYIIDDIEKEEFSNIPVY